MISLLTLSLCFYFFVWLRHQTIYLYATQLYSVEYPFQNIRKIDGGNGLSRFRLMMSDGLHTMSCKFDSFSDVFNLMCLSFKLNVISMLRMLFWTCSVEVFCKAAVTLVHMWNFMFGQTSAPKQYIFLQYFCQVHMYMSVLGACVFESWWWDHLDKEFL